MITYDWNCRKVDARPLENEEVNVVYNIHWVVTGTSNQVNSSGVHYTSTCIGSQVVAYNPEEDFVAFTDLTNDIVTGWVRSALGEEKIASIEINIENKINNLTTPESVTLTIG